MGRAQKPVPLCVIFTEGKRDGNRIITIAVGAPLQAAVFPPSSARQRGRPLPLPWTHHHPRCAARAGGHRQQWKRAGKILCAPVCHTVAPSSLSGTVVRSPKGGLHSVRPRPGRELKWKQLPPVFCPLPACPVPPVAALTSTDCGLYRVDAPLRTPPYWLYPSPVPHPAAVTSWRRRELPGGDAFLATARTPAMLPGENGTLLRVAHFWRRCPGRGASYGMYV